MARSEFNANNHLELRAIERQRWADVLRRPTVRNIKRVSRMRRLMAANRTRFSVPLPALVLGALSAVWTGVAVALFLFY